eukprot:16428830-Heterocapsa_arctica.AAC.1
MARAARRASSTSWRRCGLRSALRLRRSWRRTSAPSRRTSRGVATTLLPATSAARPRTGTSTGASWS